MSFAQGLARNADTARARKEEEERQKRAKEIQKMRKFAPCSDFDLGTLGKDQVFSQREADCCIKTGC